MLRFKSSWYRDLVELRFKMWWPTLMIQFLFSPYTRYYPSTPKSLNNLHLRSLPGSLIWWIFDKTPAVVLLYLLHVVLDILQKQWTNRRGDRCNTTWKLWGRCVAGVVPDVVGGAVGLTQSDVMLLWEKQLRFQAHKKDFVCLCLTDFTLTCLLCPRTSLKTTDKQTVDLVERSWHLYQVILQTKSTFPESVRKSKQTRLVLFKRLQ